MTLEEPNSAKYRNLISFWIFGMCNNFAYSVMLGAAQDILNKNENSQANRSSAADSCFEEITFRSCSPTSAGIVLLCNILPCLVVKTTCPFFMHRISYGVRHFIICLTQMFSLLITACADSIPVALCGVLLASFSSGFGETTYLALASHYSKNSISTWSSGSGMAGFAGTFSYAILTDAHLAALTPSMAMLAMLVVPLLFTISYYYILVQAPTVPSISIFKPNQWLDAHKYQHYRGDTSKTYSSADVLEGGNYKGKSQQESITLQTHTLAEQFKILKGLVVYMIPFGIVYFAQYLIKQGLLELVVFDCAHGFGTSQLSQYRWYQVLYHIGVFISRSSINLIQLNLKLIAASAVIQCFHMIVVIFAAVYSFIPHFGIVCAMVFNVGIVGGANYVNTFNHIHKNVVSANREFALSAVTFADTVGILAAALTSIPVHNLICELPLR